MLQQKPATHKRPSRSGDHGALIATLVCYEENEEGGFTSDLSTLMFEFFASFFASFFAFLISFLAFFFAFLISFFPSFFAFLISFFLCFDFFPFPAIAFSRAADDFNYITPALQDLIPPLQRANIDFERSSFVAVSCRQTRAAGLRSFAHR